MILVFWFLGTLMIVGALIWMVTMINKRSDSKPEKKPKDPLEAAKERYLRGEISKEELEDIARHLF